MTYKRYTKYKDSEISWIGKIPNQWECLDFRRLVNLQQGLQIAQEERFYEGGINRFEYITIKYLSSKNKKIDREYIENPNKKVICNHDDVLLARTGATGKVVTGVIGVYHNNFFKINYDRKRVLKGFLVYYLMQENIQEHFKLIAGTTTIPDLNHGEFLSTKIILPNLFEQERIIKFLDKKTLEIDSLIEEKEKLIKLLKEKREAIITEAVTKGVDKDVKMKDSGIEWIGEIPVDWNITKLKYIADSERYSIVDGPFGSDMKNEEYVDDGVPIIQLNNIGDGVHKFNNIKYITEEKAEELKRHTIYPGDIVIAKMMPAGRATIVSDKFKKYIVSSDSIRLKLNNRNNHDFIMHCLNAYGRIQAELNSTGSTRSRINISIVKNTKIAICDKEEQERVIKHLNEKLSCIDNLINENSSIISKLEEYKKALISEVVTGKIDVRNYEE